MTQGVQATSSRDARKRILVAAARLFRAQGIVATQMEAVATAAPVSKRTLYKHFPDKFALIQAYLQERDRQMFGVQLASEQDAREQILGLFTPTGTDRPIATCPFIAASTEFPEPQSEPHRAAVLHKQEFEKRLQHLAAGAGVEDPEGVGTLISLLYDGAISRSQTLNDRRPLEAARRHVAVLLGATAGAES
ncbi:TetR/AcrR family transcriptional regulator [Kribbella pratensis]|uniref:TetR family transcriptional regulator n=1 Tax=Kribbella pratensis TaxID=2512112 RepID=A0A4R8C1Z3_9ACTN|nr:TetR/AcrR family transcriptional regulator [Kribbella pratensis]TDW69758.1 TetR family transcriptional regulator [Kribbella pratensis]